MFNNFFGGLAVKAKTTKSVALFLTHGILSETGRQIVVDTPELLTVDAEIFLKSWMDAYNLAENEELENWQKMFLIWYIIKKCRELGIEKAYSIIYPPPQDVFDAMEKFFDVDILEEELPLVIAQNPILVSSYAIEVLTAFISSPKKPEEFEIFQDALAILEDCRTNGVDKIFAEFRRNTTDGHTLLKIFSQRPKTIQELSVMIKDYPLLIHPKFTENFLKFAESRENPRTKRTYIARYDFIKDVISSGYAAACAHVQAHPDETMLRETVMVYLLVDTVEGAHELIAKNPCLVLVKALPILESVIQDICQETPQHELLFRQRLNFLAMCQSKGLDMAYANMLATADPKKLEKTLDEFFEGNWTEPEDLFAQNPEMLKGDFVRMIEKSMSTVVQEEQDKQLHELFQNRLQFIEYYKTKQAIADIRVQAVERILALVREFVIADIQKAYLLVVENPVLLSSLVQKIMKQNVNSLKEGDQGFYMMYSLRQYLLQRCKSNGIEQAFAEFKLSPSSFLPENLAKKYDEFYNQIRQVEMDIDSDVRLKINGQEIGSLVKPLDLLPEILMKFVRAEDSRETATVILENPILFSDKVITTLTDFLLTLTDPNEKGKLTKKILLLQNCRENGVQETLEPFL